MTDKPDRHRRQLAGLLLAAGPLAACSSAGPRPDAAPVPPARVHVGDRWSYRQFNRYNNLAVGDLTATVTRVTPTIDVSLTGSQSADAGVERYDSAWRIFDDPTWDTQYLYSKPVDLVPANPQPGLGETTSSSYRTALGHSDYYWSQTLKVHDWQSLQVPAGKFDCLRIERIITFSHPDPMRLRSVRYDQLWYAPAVNRWVQRETRGRWLRSGGITPWWIEEDWVRSVLLSYTPAPVS